MTELDQMIANIREAARKDSFDLDELEFYSKGGTSTIFRGTHKKEPVAIKVLDKPDDKKWLNRLRQESNVLKKLNHDRVVKRVGPGLLELDRNVVLLTEFVGGETLRKLTEGKRLDDRDALFLLSEIADALHHVHDRGVVHRDLHDANIILRAGSLNDPVVIDFGVARDASLDELRNNEEYYRTFRPIGAMSHCAPEKWMSPHDAKPKSDLFSLGVMIYRGVTGEAPYWADTYIELFEQIRSGRHVQAIKCEPKISPALNEVIEDLINPDILYRMKDARTLRSRCEELLANYLPPKPQAASYNP